MISQEFIAGSLCVVAGCASQKLMQYDWYRNMMFSGHWKAYNTPSGRKWATLQNLMVIGMGLVMCLGLIEFNK